MSVLHKCVKPLLTENIRRLVLYYVLDACGKIINLTRPILNVIDRIEGDTPAIFKKNISTDTTSRKTFFYPCLTKKKAKKIFECIKRFTFHPA